MWDLTESLWIFGVISASLTGSLHCVAMCGPVAVLVPRSTQSRCLYHGGRLIAYAAFGMVAGSLGHWLLQFEALHWLGLIFSVLLFGFFLKTAGELWGLWSVSFNRLVPNRLGLHRLRQFFFKLLTKAGWSKALVLGLGSALFPCGWLYSFVAAAAATMSPWKGLLWMVAFWIGTVPALAAAPTLLQRWLAPLATLKPRLVGLFFLFLGVYTLSTKWSPLLVSRERENKNSFSGRAFILKQDQSQDWQCHGGF